MSATAVPSVQPTQVRRPWRSTVRTVFQALVGLVVILPVVLVEAGVSDIVVGGVSVLGVSAVVTRLMALPAVEKWLGRFLPWLAADPHKDGA